MEENPRKVEENPHKVEENPRKVEENPVFHRKKCAITLFSSILDFFLLPSYSSMLKVLMAVPTMFNRVGVLEETAAEGSSVRVGH